MEAVLVILAIILLCILLSHQRQATSAKDRAAHRTDGDSHVYYRKDGELRHESDCCYGCMADRVEELQSSGYQVEEVVYGRRHSGDLKW